MKFSFLAQPEAGIKLIDEIADYRLCWLEGRNGIGKTLAVRLLELITGGQPYKHATSAWRSLRMHLGPTTIVVTGLQGAQELRVQFQPDEWPENPDAGASLGLAWLDGERIDFQDVRNLLRVSRIAGDETLTTQFTNYISADAALVNRHNEHLEEQVDGLDGAISSLLGDIDGLSFAQLNLLEKRHEEAIRSRNAAANRFQSQTRLTQDLESLDRLTAVLEELREQAPDLRASSAELDQRIEELGQDRASLEEQHRHLARTVENRDALLSERERLLKLRERQAGQATKDLTRATGILRDLGVTPDLAAVRMAKSDLQDDIEQVQRNQAALRVPPDVTALIDRVRTPLDNINDARVKNEVIAVIGDTRISVSQLHEGLARRRTEVQEYRQGSLLEELDIKRRQLQQRLDSLSEAEQLLNSSERASTRLEQTEEQIQEVSVTLERGSTNRYKEVVAELDEVQRQHLGLIRERALVRSKLELLIREGLESELEERTAALGSALGVSGSTAEALLDAHMKMAVLRDELKVADDELVDAEIARSEFGGLLRQTVLLLEEDPTYQWLRDSIGNQLPTSQHAPEDSLQLIDNIVTKLTQLQMLVDKLRTEEIASVQYALEQLIQRRNSTSNYQDVYSETHKRHLEALRTYYESQFGNLLRNREVQAALFEDGKFQRLDLLHWEVSWIDKQGEFKQRPIEAFSSGERAFTYVLASVLQHTEDEAVNRVLVLDEFGAFIEAERLGRLQRFLDEQVLRAGLANQIVVILPLRQEPDGDAADARSRDILERGYFMSEKMSVTSE